MTADLKASSGFPPLAIRAQLRWHVVQPIVAELHPSTVIEIGVGQGAISARIAALASQSYVGFELDAHAFSVAKPRIERVGGVVHNVALDAIAPPPAQLLCAFEVLEHIEDDEAALKEWIGYIAPGGALLLSVPSNPKRFGAMDKHAGHFRRYDHDRLVALVASLGLVDVSATDYGLPLGYALEAVRNRIDARKLSQSSPMSAEALTASSGRTFQFEDHSWKSALATAGTAPFKHLQTVWPGGIGLVLVARTKPAPNSP